MNDTTFGSLLLATPLLTMMPATAQVDPAQIEKLEQQYKVEIAFPYVKENNH